MSRASAGRAREEGEGTREFTSACASYMNVPVQYIDRLASSDEPARARLCNGYSAPLPDAQEFTRVQREELGVSGGLIIKQ